MTYIRGCTSAQFNTGQSTCPVPRGKIKGLIFVQRGYTLPEDLTADNIEVAEHADRPNRIYPVKTVEEYAASGGEAQFSQTGYGANNLTSYSSLQETYTLDARDMGLVANLVNAKNAMLDVYLVNDSNVIFGEEDSNGNFIGIPISSVAIGGQQFDSSGQVAFLNVIINYKDVEQHWKREAVREVDFDLVSMMIGLVNVTFAPIKANGDEYIYKLIEKHGGLDVTGAFGRLIAENLAETVPSATTASYLETKEDVSVSIGDSSSIIPPVIVFDGYSATNIPQLAAASVLQTVGIIGITQE